MGIEALPTSTVRTIGATQVLNDSASVIKELLDNALDAQSTAISIEIHSTTLDSIQVRDNGHGIPPEDRLLVARPHCTSKISGEEDLKAIGGTSLGFRGEALASAAEMSGSLTISTRVEGEQVATALKINQQGEVIGQDRASLPVGTTVKITDFIKAHPVRRQVALKNAEKTFSKIKQTLKSYAFARPHVRLSLRILKAKNDKGNWTYAPKSGGNAEDAAFKIVGTTCASQCTWSVIEDHGFTLQAFLPRPDAEVSKYSSIGPFISIDARPVSAARGIPKQIVKIFRDALKKAKPRAEGVKEPFIFLDIRCPSASYDANVEPAKDDVLFEDPDALIGMVRRLFEAVYPALETPTPVDCTSQAELLSAQQPPHRLDEDDFTTSLEPAPAGSTRESPSLPWTPLPSDASLPLFEGHDEALPRGRAFRSNMYSCDEEDLDTVDERPPTGRTEADFEEIRQARNDVNVSNPWILAKMNATAKHQPSALEIDEDVLTSSNTPHVQNRGEDRRRSAPNLPTPGPSPPTKPTETRFRSDADTNRRADKDGRSIGSQPLPPPGPTITPLSTSDVDRFDEMTRNQTRQAPGYNYNPPAQDEAQPSGTPLHMIPDPPTRRRQSPRKTVQHNNFNTAFKAPGRDPPEREKVWFDHLENIDRPRPPKRPYQARENNGLVVQGELGDLVDDPRPLTPPRRNRDMRDFFTPREQEASQPVTDLIEARQYAQQRRARSANGSEDQLQDVDDGNRDQMSGVLGGRGFIAASELQALGGRFDPLKSDTSRAHKQRKTSERRTLEEISGNARVQDDATDGEREAGASGRTGSMRRRTTGRSSSKSRRTKSSRLPLERVPKGQGTHDVVLSLSKSMREISSIAGSIEEERSLLGWNETSLDCYNVFATMSDPVAVQDITAKLQELLTSHVPEGDMVQDLGVVVQGALAAHAQDALEMDV